MCLRQLYTPMQVSACIYVCSHVYVWACILLQQINAKQPVLTDPSHLPNGRLLPHCLAQFKVPRFGGQLGFASRPVTRASGRQ